MTFTGMNGTCTLAVPAGGGTATAMRMLMLLALLRAGVADVLAEGAEIAMVVGLPQQHVQCGLADRGAVQ